MSETIVLDPTAVATNRTQLDITAFVSGDGIDWGDAAIEAFMAETSRGQVPIDFRVPNRTVTIPLKLRPVGATSFETIRQQLQAKAGLFQREGGWLSRQTSVGTVYADVVNATLRLGGSWAAAFRSMDTDAVMTIECIPDFYGAEITLDDKTETTSAELITVLKQGGSNAVIAGNYPARCRVVVDDDQGRAQSGLIWGFRSRNYDSAATAALAYEAEALTPLDAAALATITGASGASNNVVRHSNLATIWTPVLSTQIAASGHMTHAGSYRAWARCYSTSSPSPRMRLAWDVGDLSLPVVNEAQTLPGVSQFYAIDLGEVRLDRSPVGTHRWQGVIQAISDDTSGKDISVDKVWFQPLDEAAGTLRAPNPVTEGITLLSARDEFNQTAGTLTGKVLPLGGTWAGAGDADDFSVSGSGFATRGAASDTDTNTGRYALAGTATFTNCAVSVDWSQTVDTTASGQLNSGVLARYTDTNNWLMALRGHFWTQVPSLLLVKRVAGSALAIYQRFSAAEVGGLSATLGLAVTAAGAWTIIVDGVVAASGADPDLATGGALASGRVGIYDNNTSATVLTRTYDNFVAYVPSFDAVIHASQSAELRTEGAFREDSTGTAYGPVSWVTGDLPRVPCSGLENRAVELFVKASRGDLGLIADAGIDDVSARVSYRPSWLFVPS